jgi:hypothetical protein
MAPPGRILRVNRGRDARLNPHARGHHVQTPLLQSSRARACQHVRVHLLFRYPHRTGVSATSSAGLSNARSDDRGPLGSSHNLSQQDKSLALLPCPHCYEGKSWLLVLLQWLPLHHQYRRWHPQLDKHQERYVDQAIPDQWHRTFLREGLGSWHRPTSWHLPWHDQSAGDGSHEQPTDGVYNNAEVIAWLLHGTLQHIP